jgi:F-type H+-transporting ATPase subunit delta
MKKENLPLKGRDYHKVSFRYSNALFLLNGTLAQQEKRVDDLKKLTTFLQDRPKLKQFFLSPQIHKEEKSNLLKKLFSDGLDKDLLRFLLLLLEKGRLKQLPDIVQQYHEIVKKNLGIQEVSLISAVPLENEAIKQLKEKLEKYYQKNVEILHKIDPQIIGGAILIVGYKMLDYSIKDRLANLKENLLAITI